MTTPSSGLPPINYNDPHLYEHLSLIISEFEKAALRSESRQAMMATAQSTLSAMDQIMASSDQALNMNRTANANRVSSRNQASSTSDSWESPGFRLEGSGLTQDGTEPAADSWKDGHSDLNWVASGADRPERPEDGDIEHIKEPSFTAGVEGSVQFDADFNELFNGDPGGAQIGDWLKDCLGCDLRVNFDWQMQPVDLLLPLGNLVGDINSALDKFEGFFDENQLMANLCDLLNGLNFLCIPDLLAILMALKMLLKSYLTFQLGLKIDWTALLGPILKMILDGIVTLLQQIAGIIVAPLDCAYAAIMSIAQLQEEIGRTADLAAAVGARVADRAAGTLSDNETNASSTFKDVTTTHHQVEGVRDDARILKDRTIPAIEVSERDSQEAQVQDSFSFPDGFQVTSETKLPDALNDRKFLTANPFKKLAVSVQEARRYIMDLVRKIILALRSLEGLVSGTLSLSLGNLGLILFVRDMIRLVMIIIQLFKGRNVDDWCEYLSNNPEVLEGVVPDTQSRYDANREKIVLTRGPEVVAEINTCSTGRTGAQAALMQKWVTDLKRAGSL